MRQTGGTKGKESLAITKVYTMTPRVVGKTEITVMTITIVRGNDMTSGMIPTDRNGIHMREMREMREMYAISGDGLQLISVFL